MNGVHDALHLKINDPKITPPTPTCAVSDNLKINKQTLPENAQREKDRRQPESRSMPKLSSSQIDSARGRKSASTQAHHSKEKGAITKQAYQSNEISKKQTKERITINQADGDRQERLLRLQAVAFSSTVAGCKLLSPVSRPETKGTVTSVGSTVPGNRERVMGHHERIREVGTGETRSGFSSLGSTVLYWEKLENSRTSYRKSFCERNRSEMVAQRKRCVGS